MYIVGQGYDPWGSYIWQANTDGTILGPTDIPLRPYGVTSDALVVGVAGGVAAVWQEDNFYWGLPLINGGDGNEARDVNAGWEVVGREYYTDPDTSVETVTGVYWKLLPDGTVEESHSLGDFLPVGISDSGFIVGRRGLPEEPAIGMLDGAGNLTVTGLGFPEESLQGFGIGVNNFGEACAHYDVVFGKPEVQRFRGFQWTASNGLENIGAFGKAGLTYVWGINDDGNIVGESSDRHARHAFLWDGQELHNLNDEIPAEANVEQLWKASGINSMGQITCRGWNNGGTVWKAYLLTPVP
ncbi:MAG: hypothetical protein CMJ50_02800 [Planctomycetaceae bacterium]|nr:hypothetical protein [Planctomycetaceae bacterium]